MEYTNRANLPAEIVSAITKDRYSDSSDLPSDFSASKLINPIQLTTLANRYKDNLVIEDVLDMYWRFKGSVAHQVLEDSWHESMGSRIEERLYMDVEGKTLSGKFDCYHDGEIRDYKFTKVYKYMKNDWTEWEAQLNIYAELLERAGHKVDKITIWCFFEDFKKNDRFKAGYPYDPIVSIPLNLWDSSARCEYIKQRVIALKQAEEMDDCQLAECFPCSDRECWSDVKDWAIIKNGSDRATKCFDTEDEAIACFEEKYELATHQVTKRLTPKTRCLEYCPVRHICRQNNPNLQHIPKGGTNGETEGFVF